MSDTLTTPDLLALVRACREHPDEHDIRLRLADCLQESGQEERAEYVRLGVELEAMGAMPECVSQDGTRFSRRHPGECGFRDCPAYPWHKRHGHLTARRAELAARLAPAWPCPGCGGKGLGSPADGPPCPTCGGSGDVLRHWSNPSGTGIESGDTVMNARLPLELDHAGYPQWVTVPTLDSLVEECRYCDGRGGRYGVPSMDRANNTVCRTCGGAIYRPTPRLTALAASPPWGVPLDGVMVVDSHPHESILANGSVWFQGSGDPQSVPKPIFDRLPGRPVPACGSPRSHKTFDTPDLARRALGRTLLAFARGAE